MMDQNIINLGSYCNHMMVKDKKEIYRPMDADKWSQYFKDIIDAFPDCKIELI